MALGHWRNEFRYLRIKAMSIQRFIFSTILVIGVYPLAFSQTKTALPDWAQPASATHKQVSPPADFHRPARTINVPLGIFDGQSDVGAALVEGSSSYDKATKQYTITSAG